MNASAFEENALKVFRAKMEQALQDAAEPLIQQALQDIEKAMRARVAQAALTLVQHSYSMHTRNDRLEISVNLGAMKDLP